MERFLNLTAALIVSLALWGVIGWGIYAVWW